MGLEDIKQRLKKSATVGEVEDVATGRQLLEMGISGLVVLLAFLVAGAAMVLLLPMLGFVCAGPNACPFITLPNLFFYFIFGPAIVLLVNLGSIWFD